MKLGCLAVRKADESCMLARENSSRSSFLKDGHTKQLGQMHELLAIAPAALLSEVNVPSASAS